MELRARADRAPDRNVLFDMQTVPCRALAVEGAENVRYGRPHSGECATGNPQDERSGGDGYARAEERPGTNTDAVTMGHLLGDEHRA